MDPLFASWERGCVSSWSWSHNIDHMIQVASPVSLSRFIIIFNYTVPAFSKDGISWNFVEKVGTLIVWENFLISVKVPAFSRAGKILK